MKRFLLLIFMILWFCAAERIGISCAIPPSLCVDDVYDFKTCAYLGWNLLNFTCAELGIATSKCCKWGKCDEATPIACALAGGVYYKPGECWNCTGYSSCCFDTYCDGVLDEIECTNSGGNFFAGRHCNGGVCAVQTHLLGSCCDSVLRRCYETTQEYCGDVFTLGKNCLENGCYPPGAIRTTSVPGAGRCCASDCWEHSDNTTCDNIGQYFEEGLLCNSYPCTPKGVCIESGKCIDEVPERLCELSGGSFTGGYCDVGELGACFLRQGCNMKANTSCTAFGGNWVEGEVCPTTVGACCQSKSTQCYNIPMTECPIQYYEFTPGKNCNEIICQPNGCCVSDFCAADGIPESFCLSAFRDSYLNNGTCRVTGSCKDIISFFNGSKSIDIDVAVNHIQINTKDVQLHFLKSVSVTNIVFSLRNSNLTTESLLLEETNIQFDFTSHINCEGTLTISSSYLEVDLTPEESILLTSENQVLITSGTLLGEFNGSTIRIDNETQSDYFILYQDNQIFLGYNKTEREITESVLPEAKFPAYVVILIIAFVLVAAAVTIIAVPDLRKLIISSNL